MRTVLCHIAEIRQGDTIIHGGEMRTVCGVDIKYGFMGISIFGDSYECGNQLVEKVVWSLR